MSAKLIVYSVKIVHGAQKSPLNLKQVLRECKMGRWMQLKSFEFP